MTDATTTPPEDSFHELMEQVRAGDKDAAWRLIDLYGNIVLHVVRRHLNSSMRSKFDSMDFYQVVWASFFRSPDEIRSFAEPKDLINFLCSMTQNKVGMEARRRLQTVKYNVAREQAAAVPSDDSSTGGGQEPADTRQPSPSQLAIARETWERMVERLPEQERAVVELRFQAMTFDEIAQKLGIHERQARRIIDRVLSRGRLGE